MTVYVRQYIKACEAFGSENGPEYSTKIQEMQNKREKRNAQWSQPRRFYSLIFQNIRVSLYRGVAEMFHNRRGRWGCFLFNDRLDNLAVDQQFAIAEAGQTEFQLSTLSEIDFVMQRTNVYALYRPDPTTPGASLEVTPVVSVDGDVAAGWSFDPDRGMAYAPAPMTGGEVLTWSGQFSRWVRFDQDRLPFSIDNRSGDEFVVNGSVDLLEVPPPTEASSSSS